MKLVCKEFEVEVVEVGIIRVEDLVKKLNIFIDDEDLEYFEFWFLVVIIMGYVDYGKVNMFYV